MNTVQLSNGSGRGLNSLLDEVILPSLKSSPHDVNEDAAVVNWNTPRLAFTTDSFVVTPLSFPGGDIGKIAACGTINDLSMMGAVPRFMAVALIIEDGLPVSELKEYCTSLANVCKTCNVKVVCGDTKVVEKGNCDGLYITTSGIGELHPVNTMLSASNASSDDQVIVSGPIGLHGITILAQRENLSFASTAISDCAPLLSMAQTLVHTSPNIKVMRDATRGGCAAILNEIAQSSDVTIQLDQKKIPIPDVVRGACSFLGLDPLHIANEGTFIAIVKADDASKCINALHQLPDGKGAQIIGSVKKKGRYPVELITEIGGIRPVEIPHGLLLPRIC
jgi:hydrogenase expression/formation protein HypE